MNTIVTKCSSLPGDEVATLRVPWPQLVAGRLLVPGDCAGPEHNLLSLQTQCHDCAYQPIYLPVGVSFSSPNTISEDFPRFHGCQHEDQHDCNKQYKKFHACRTYEAFEIELGFHDYLLCHVSQVHCIQVSIAIAILLSHLSHLYFIISRFSIDTIVN